MLEQLSEEKIKDAEIRKLAKKVTIEFDLGLDEDYVKRRKNAHVLEIKCRDGRVFKNRVDYPKDSMENSFTDREFENKFRSLVDFAIGKEKIECISSMWQELEYIEKINSLGRLLY